MKYLTLLISTLLLISSTGLASDGEPSGSNPKDKNGEIIRGNFPVSNPEPTIDFPQSELGWTDTSGPNSDVPVRVKTN